MRAHPLAGARLYLLATAAVARVPLAQAVEAALRGGVDVVQFREKHLDDAAFREALGPVLDVCTARGVPLLVNDRVGVAAAVRAAGVHVGQEDAPVADARAALPDGALVGVSTHDAAELARALADGADHVGVGCVFATSSKGAPVPVVGPDGAARLCARAEAAGVPAFAIGGIKPDNVGQLVRAGVRRVAVCAGILATDDPERAAREIRSALCAAR